MLGLSFTNYMLLIGQAGWYFWLLAMLPMTFFVAVYVTLYSRQAEARAQAQRLLADLEIANRQLSEYAARVEDLTITAERQRMARELHDTLSQGLAGLILQLEAADAHLEGARPERARLILEKSMEKARETLAEARLAIDDLRHATPRSLEAAVRQEAGHFTDSTGIPCTPEIDLPADIPDPVSEAAIRLSMEGLTNIARHAHATRVTLRIAGVEEKDKAALELEICDNGAGFDPEKVEPGHYGLLGMRERVRLAGGSLELRSAPGQGTCLLARFPLRSEKFAREVGAA
jgi:NarL family two-component system sensor histidine kinase YdfH